MTKAKYEQERLAKLISPDDQMDLTRAKARIDELEAQLGEITSPVLKKVK